jgi:hypothetical protein
MIEDKEKKQKELKQEFYILKKQLRSLPAERQIYIYKSNNS